ncbi:hypothetical protein Hamer_G025751 [Homarus americanus]|uniref:Uncharacterized protein n=1 Tax=Homarus americanus TaxID=6706 RepID=A0A8J5MRQ2_HOMAM|nr:hypothetical protein Hamer_G025751 [Homarus americanus]
MVVVVVVVVVVVGDGGVVVVVMVVVMGGMVVVMVVVMGGGGGGGVDGVVVVVGGGDNIMKVAAALLCLATVASARMAYQFSDGYLEILGAEPTELRLRRPRLRLLRRRAHRLPGTVFSQESLTPPQEAFPCDQAETLYDLSNADFGKIPEENL